MKNSLLAMAFLAGCSMKPAGKIEKVSSRNTPQGISARRDTVEECKVLERLLGYKALGAKLGEDPGCIDVINTAALLIYRKILIQCINLKPRACDERLLIEDAIQEEFDEGTIPAGLCWKIRERVLELATEYN